MAYNCPFPVRNSFLSGPYEQRSARLVYVQPLITVGSQVGHQISGRYTTAVIGALSDQRQVVGCRVSTILDSVKLREMCTTLHVIIRAE